MLRETNHSKANSRACRCNRCSEYEAATINSALPTRKVENRCLYLSGRSRFGLQTPARVQDKHTILTHGVILVTNNQLACSVQHPLGIVYSAFSGRSLFYLVKITGLWTFTSLVRSPLMMSGKAERAMGIRFRFARVACGCAKAAEGQCPVGL